MVHLWQGMLLKSLELVYGRGGDSRGVVIRESECGSVRVHDCQGARMSEGMHIGVTGCQCICVVWLPV